MISGCVFVRNGVQNGYPFLESIRSLLPLVDECVVVAGDSTDQTTELLETEARREPKIRIIRSVWDLRPRDGLVLSEQTNLALKESRAKSPSDWCFLLQSDEILHEQDYPEIRDALIVTPPACEGIAFKYNHFYGSPKIIQHTCTSYRREVRIVRPGMVSVGDGQSFRRPDGKKLRARTIDAYIYHYGWARPQDIMIQKTQAFDALYKPIEPQESVEPARYKNLLGLYPFSGTHPGVMQNWLDQNRSDFDPGRLRKAWKLKDIRKIVVDYIEFWTGFRIGERRSYDEF
jgi:glycosyltransferase involved in cell wall biosynthesis